MTPPERWISPRKRADRARIAELEADLGLQVLPSDPPRSPAPLRESPMVSDHGETRAPLHKRVFALVWTLFGVGFFWCLAIAIAASGHNSPMGYEWGHHRWTVFVLIGLMGFPAFVVACIAVGLAAYGLWALGVYLITGKGIR